MAIRNVWLFSFVPSGRNVLRKNTTKKLKMSLVDILELMPCLFVGTNPLFLLKVEAEGTGFTLDLSRGFDGKLLNRT